MLRSPSFPWRSLAAGVIVVAITGSLAACGSSSSSSNTGTQSASNAGATTSPSGKKQFVLVLDDLTNPVELPLRNGAQAAASKYGFSLKIVGPSPATAQAQISLLNDLAATKPAGVVVLPVDSQAVVPAINSLVSQGIPVATTELDAPTSKRAFYYFGGSLPLDQGAMQAQHVFQYLSSRHSTGTVNYVVTSCLPTVTGQQDRYHGFTSEVAKLNKTSPFQLHQVGFYNTTTDPAKNLSNIQNIYTAQHGKIKVAYAMCGPDTQNWGAVLQQNGDHSILVAGYDWLPRTLDAIQAGYVSWSLGSSLYQEGFHTFTVMYQHAADGTPLPSGVIHSTSTFADQADLAQVRNSPDVKTAG